MIEGNCDGNKFDDGDVVNWEDYIPAGEYNPHNVRPWLIYNVYGTLAIVFCDNEGDALGIAADNDKLKGHKIDRDDPDYDDENGLYNGEEVDYLGNASEPYDLSDVNIKELPNPPRSFVGMTLMLKVNAVAALFEKHKANYILHSVQFRYRTEFVQPEQAVGYLEERLKGMDEKPDASMDRPLYELLLAEVKKIR